jgi:hypothetical protein
MIINIETPTGIVDVRKFLPLFFVCFFAQLGSTQSRSGALHYEQDG